MSSTPTITISGGGTLATFDLDPFGPGTYSRTTTAISWGGHAFNPNNPGTPPAVTFFSEWRVAINITGYAPDADVTITGGGAFVGTHVAPVDQPGLTSCAGAPLDVTLGYTGGTAPVALAIFSGPSHGTLIAQGGAVWRYTANAGFSGVDSFVFSASDGVYPGSYNGTCTITVSPSNVITSASPSGGAITGATPVTITGTGLTGVTAIDFGAVAATSVVVVDDNHITCVAPAHAQGAVNLSVHGYGACSPPLVNGYTYGSLAITSISPNEGVIQGGTAFTIHGINITSGAVVKFDGLPATSIVVAGNGLSLTGVTPAHAAAFTNVVVTLLDSQTASLSLGYRYFGPPNLFSSPPFQTPGQWALHRFDVEPSRGGPSGNKGNV